MEIGKSLPFGNSMTKGMQNCCIPSVYANVFNDRYFFLFYKSLKRSIGVTMPEEFKMMYEYKKLKNGFLNTEDSIVPLNIFETNGKYSIPERYLTEIFEDTPPRGIAFCYFVKIVNTKGIHSNAVIRHEDDLYLIDSLFDNVLIIELDHFLSDAAYLKRITSLSVLHNIDKVENIEYEASNFAHIIG